MFFFHKSYVLCTVELLTTVYALYGVYSIYVDTADSMLWLRPIC